MAGKKGSEIFAETVEALDLYPMFGNPGTTELPMLRNIKNYILTLHDSISVGMADGLTQFTGKPRIVNLHDLPGLANSMAFIYTAKFNRTPIIITAGQQDTRHTVYDPLLYYDLFTVIGDSVKYKYEIKNVNDIPVALKKAKQIAMSPPMGPVFISFPMDFMDKESENYEKVKDFTNSYEIIDHNAVKYIAEKINESKNPALVFGFEIDMFNAFKEAEEIADLIGCPVYGEPLSHRSVFNTENKHYAGDLMPGSTLINMKLLNHDLIIFVGGDITLYPYLSSPILPGKDIIFVGMNLTFKTGESFLMNPKLFLIELKKYVKKKCDFSRPVDLTWQTRVARERTFMGINYVLSQAKKYFHDFTIVDESISASYSLRNIFGYGHNKYFTAKSGQLGWANAASLGIGLANKNVLAVVGDGSFLYTVQSLYTAKRYSIPVKFFVLKNDSYNILRSYAKSYYPELENADYLKFDLNIEKIANSFGVESIVAGNDLKEMQWLSEGEDPKVLVVNVDKSVPKLFL